MGLVVLSVVTMGIVPLEVVAAAPETATMGVAPLLEARTAPKSAATCVAPFEGVCTASKIATMGKVPLVGVRAASISPNFGARGVRHHGKAASPPKPRRSSSELPLELMLHCFP